MAFGLNLKIFEDKGSAIGFNENGNLGKFSNEPYLQSMRFDKNTHDIHENITQTTGNEKKVLMYLIRIVNQNNSNITGQIIGKNMDFHLNMSRNSRETALKRLKK
jgi:hypothetical protein